MCLKGRKCLFSLWEYVLKSPTQILFIALHHKLSFLTKTFFSFSQYHWLIRPSGPLLLQVPLPRVLFGLVHLHKFFHPLDWTSHCTISLMPPWLCQHPPLSTLSLLVCWICFVESEDISFLCNLALNAFRLSWSDKLSPISLTSDTQLNKPELIAEQWREMITRGAMVHTAELQSNKFKIRGTNQSVHLVTF